MNRQNGSAQGGPEVAPLLIGPPNCLHALGVTWRWLRDHATELGLEVVRIGGKSFVDAQAARAAILSRASHAQELEVPPTDELTELRRRLGYRKRAS